MRRPEVNANFFGRWSPSMAYILGFIFADGCLVEHSNGYHGLDITSKDLSLLRRIKEKIGAEHKIGKKERGYRIQIRNRKIYNDLIELGLTPRKSKTIKFPRFPVKYAAYFIRGLFDGDGSVMIWRESRWRHTWQIRTSFASGCLEFLQDLGKYLASITGLSGGKISPLKRGYHLRYVSMSECLKLYKFMYQNNHSIFLKRKKDKFELFLSLKSKETKSKLKLMPKGVGGVAPLLYS